MPKRKIETAPVDEAEAELLAYMAEQSGTLSEPGTLKTGDVVNKSTNEDAPFPMMVREVSSAGYTMVYDRITGDPSLVNRNMLPTVLQKKDPDTGKLVFTLTDPGVRPPEGLVKCRLHLDDPDRLHWAEVGFPTCRKSNLRTPYELTRHMARRHPSENAVIKEEEAREERHRLDRERIEDREFRRILLEKLTEK